MIETTNMFGENNNSQMPTDARWFTFYKPTGTITSYSNQDAAPTEVIIPEYIDGIKVTEIGDNAFWSCSRLTSITLSNSITEVGYAAFRGCDGLNFITLPNSITFIRDLAFCGCSSLVSLDLPNSVIVMADHVFDDCHRLTHISVNKPKDTVKGAPWGANKAQVVWMERIV